MKQLQRALLRYPGFKSLVLVSIVLFLAGLAVTARLLGAFEIHVADLADHFWLEYLYTYWVTHAGLALVLAVAFAVFGVLDLGRSSFENYAPLEPPEPQDPSYDSKIQKLNNVLLVIIAPLAVGAIPLSHLCFPRWSRVLALVVDAGVVVLAYWTALVRPVSATERRRLGSFTVASRLSFDTASLGVEVQEVKRELQAYENQRRLTAISGKGQAWLHSGDGSTHWKGLRQFYLDLATFMESAPEWLTLHETTTAAVKFACQTVSSDGKPVVVLTTDMEYGSVSRTVEQVFKDVRIAPLRMWALENRPSSDVLSEKAAESFIELGEDIPAGSRVLIVTSHVYYETGFVLDYVRLQEALRTRSWELMAVIDGAQAMGNVVTPKRLGQSCTFYATSGHKWMMGRPSLGVLVHQPSKLVPKFSEGAERLTRPFCSMKRLGEDYHSETMALEPLISLNAMLGELRTLSGWAEHNQALAKVFATQVGRIGNVKVVTERPETGLVTLQVTDAVGIMNRLEVKHEMVGRALNEQLLRFAFHFYHGEREVYRLIAALQAECHR